MPDFRVKVTVDSREGTANLGDLENAERKAGSQARQSAEYTLEYSEAVSKLKESAKAAFGVIGIGFGAEELFRDAITATSKFDKALSQVQAGIISTGGAAGISSPELQAGGPSSERFYLLPYSSPRNGKHPAYLHEGR